MTRSMRLLENPRVYRLWQMPFAEAKFAPVRRHGEPTAARRRARRRLRPRDECEILLEVRLPRTRHQPEVHRAGKAALRGQVRRGSRHAGRAPRRGAVRLRTRQQPPPSPRHADVRKLLAAVARHLDADGNVHIVDSCNRSAQGLPDCWRDWIGAFSRAPLSNGRRCSRRHSSLSSSSPIHSRTGRRSGTWCTSRAGHGDDHLASDIRGDRPPERGAGDSGARSASE